MVAIKVKRLDPAAQLPRYAHAGLYGDLAADLYACCGLTLARAGESGSTQAVQTGIAMEFPATHGALVEDRSGLAVRGVTTLAGVIDPGYRGEIKVVITNLSVNPVAIQPGDRIAQLRIVERIEASFEEVDELGEAARGAGGFGSTGA
jgi:dUTP pyrophosphatase